MKKILSRDGMFGLTEIEFWRVDGESVAWCWERVDEDGYEGYDPFDDHYECGCCTCCGCMCDWNDLYDE